MKEMEEICTDSEFSAADGECGFTLVEVTIALVVFLVALLGVFVTFTYAISYNAGNNSRAQALSVLQREVELMRSAKFTPVPGGTDSQAPTSSTDDRRDITGGIKAARTVTSGDGNRFIVVVKVDDDPFTDGIQTDSTKTIKEITVTVTLDSPTPGWQTSIPATVILRRVRGN